MNREETLVSRKEQGPDAELHPALKLRLARERIFFGPGPAELLTQIRQTDSVRMACEQMGISYSKGWKMINTIEEELGYQVTKRQQGGRNGGSASLTPEGETLLAKYQELERRSQEAVGRIFDELFGPLDL
ncbi:LysR family transcriptional regulator [Eubacterium sp. 1001713B170207_170306_E7]|uniref:winged helix-turn-helix domain-containing protein n=1 Tax=Eubacterium sp. 1001713B170207_170306_E7 TaxID=2787097 RepID=UPI00189A278C|nr:LysR family transcriptional regulator [Eubacterium sp. 1001713B170207_170306_E7]